MLPNMIPIPGGSIVLQDARRKTSRAVQLRSFAIARAPVTWSLYSRVLDLQVPDQVAHDAPVDSISWIEAVQWCNAASGVFGYLPAYTLDSGGPRWDVSADGFRLPTEAEWEWACRANSTGPHYGPLADIAWTDADNVTTPQKVESKLPNAFGIYDMLGNVWEWCWDYMDPARYADYRVLRGGGWADKHWSVRASVRRGSMPGAQLDDVGFRLAQGAVDVNDAQAGQGWSLQADTQRARVRGRIPSGWTPLRLS